MRPDRPPSGDELAALAQEAGSFAQRLARLTEPARQPDAIASRGERAARIRRYLRARRARDQLFTAELFADPAWDILLDLYASGVEGQPVSITSACIAAAVPPTTALRWLRTLERSGLIERVDDSRDCRRSFVRLSTRADEALDRWISLSPLVDCGGLDHSSDPVRECRAIGDGGQ